METTTESGLHTGDIRLITADAAPEGYEFDQWSGDVSVLDNAFANPATVTIPASNVTLTASYKLLVSGLSLTWDDIANVPVADASSVSDWNTRFNLPTNGTPFTSVIVAGNTVNLIGGGNIALTHECFGTNGIKLPNLISIVDDGYVTRLSNGVFSWYGGGAINMVDAIFPEVTQIDTGAFNGCDSLTTISIPKCTALGPDVVSYYVFNGITGNNITLTIPVALMTCNGGAPDGDIQTLQSNNTVTIITV